MTTSFFAFTLFLSFLRSFYKLFGQPHTPKIGNSPNFREVLRIKNGAASRSKTMNSGGKLPENVKQQAVSLHKSIRESS
jgi:hypothetical protein